MKNIYLEIKKRICKYCLKEFELSLSNFMNHCRHCDKNTKYNHSEFVKKRFDSIKLSLISKKGQFKNFCVKCKICGKKFFVYEREKLFPKKEKYFCGSSCANKRIYTDETRKRISIGTSLAIQKIIEEDPEKAKRIWNGRIKCFCSANEIEIRNHFINSYPDEKWTFGGVVSLKKYGSESGLSRDLYSDKLKVCIEYDGIWHFQEIYNQLKHKTIKDFIFEKWCKDNKYRLIRIDSDTFLTDKLYYLNKIRDIIENKNEQITLLYTDKNRLLLENNRKKFIK